MSPQTNKLCYGRTHDGATSTVVPNGHPMELDQHDIFQLDWGSGWCMRICTCIYMCLHAPFRLQHLRKNPFREVVPGNVNMVILESRSKQTLFSKWLPRPNHYAHRIRIEILCRTPVSMFRDLSPRPQNHIKISRHSFLVWTSTWILRAALQSVPCYSVLFGAILCNMNRCFARGNVQ